MTVAVPGRGFTQVTINTSKIQEKAQATRAVYEHAKAMGAAFGPYVETCFEIFIPLVTFKYSSDVRSCAAQTLSAVFDAACSHGEQVGMQFPRKYLPLLADAISKQVSEEDTTDMEALWALADSLSEIYYIVYRYRTSPLGSEILTSFTFEHANRSVQACMTAMTACLERRSNMTRVLSGALTGDDEKEEYSQMLSTETNLLTPLVDSVGYTLKFLRQDFLPLFEKYIVPTLSSSLLPSSADLRASVSAMCLFDDCVEHCGPNAAAKYGKKLLEGIVFALENPKDKDLVQAAVYGVCQLARYGSTCFSPEQVQTIVLRLQALTSRSKEDSGEDVYLVEIAASALASLTLWGPFGDLKFASRESLVGAFLQHLPIQQDFDEAKVCHAGLCTLIESGSIDLGVEANRVTRIIREIIADVQDGEEIASPDTCERLTTIFYQLEKQFPQGKEASPRSVLLL